MFKCLVIKGWNYLRRIRRPGIIEVGLLVGAGCEVSKVGVRPNSPVFLLPIDYDVEFSLFSRNMSAYVLPCSCHEDNG